MSSLVVLSEVGAQSCLISESERVYVRAVASTSCGVSGTSDGSGLIGLIDSACTLYNCWQFSGRMVNVVGSEAGISEMMETTCLPLIVARIVSPLSKVWVGLRVGVRDEEDSGCWPEFHSSSNRTLVCVGLSGASYCSNLCSCLSVKRVNASTLSFTARSGIAHPG